MKSEAKPPLKTYNSKFHLCHRHHDLTNLLKRAKTPICNHCFATLKKTYFNVIAGLLLGELYLHNLTTAHVSQIHILDKRLRATEDAVLNLQAELTELKKGNGNHENPRPQPTDHTVPDTIQAPGPDQETRPAEVSPGGHVPRARKELSQLPQARINHYKAMRHKKNAQVYPKTDDLQDSSTSTPTNNTKSVGEIIQDIQDKDNST